MKVQAVASRRKYALRSSLNAARVVLAPSYDGLLTMDWTMLDGLCAVGGAGRASLPSAEPIALSVSSGARWRGPWSKTEALSCWSADGTDNWASSWEGASMDDRERGDSVL